MFPVPGSRFPVRLERSRFAVRGWWFAALVLFVVLEPRTAVSNHEPEPGTGNRELATAQDALPDPDAFLRDVRANLTRSQEAYSAYAYRERRTDLHTNPFGRLGMGDIRVVDVTPSIHAELTFRREIERNGIPLPAEALARQDREHRAKVAALERRLAGEDGDDAAKRARQALLARRRADAMLQDVVDTLRFDVVRREMRDGVPMIVISFAARPAARPRTREGRIAKVFTGSAWVHEAAREVVHVDAVASDDVAFGGFVAKLYEGTRSTVERQEIEPGLWMPTKVTLTGGARALFRKMKIDFVVEWFEYRPLENPKSQIPNPRSQLNPNSQIPSQLPQLPTPNSTPNSIWGL